MHNPSTMDENNSSCRPAGESLERKCNDTNMASFNQSISSLDTIFESTTEFARRYDDFGTAAHNSWDGGSCAYDCYCCQRDLKQECCCEQDNSFPYDTGSRFCPIATPTRHNKQRQRSPASRRVLMDVRSVSLGADSHRPNSPTSRITPGSTSISSNQDRWQSVVTSAATTRVPASVAGTRPDSPKKEGIQYESLTMKSLPREKEMKNCEKGPPTIEKLLEQKWEREQEEILDLAASGGAESAQLSSLVARGA
jgi:hypothetical protein